MIFRDCAYDRTDATIKENPPTIYHLHEQVLENKWRMPEGIGRYRETLPEHRRVLLDRFKIRISPSRSSVSQRRTMCAVSS